MHCFADSLGADSVVLVARADRSSRSRAVDGTGSESADGAHNGGIDVLAAWARDDRDPEVSWARGSLLRRAFGGAGSLLEADAGANSHGPHRAVVAPVRKGEDVIGAIYARFDPATQAEGEHIRWAADSYARLAGLCMSGDFALATVLGSSGSDALTGCLDYAGVVGALRAEVERSRRQNHAVSVGFFDLDGFKRVNDAKGHLEGNEVLAATGAALRSSARIYDAVGRFGGDEFVVVLPETGIRQAGEAAARFRDGVRAAIAEATTIPVDVSVGVAEWDGQSTPLELLASADRSSREAKADGGGRVRSQSPPAGRFDGLAELTRTLVAALDGSRTRR